MSTGTKAVERIIDLKERAVERAETEHAAANAAAQRAVESEASIRAAFVSALDAHDDVGSAWDLEARDMRIRGLRRRVHLAEQTSTEARTKRAATERALAAARIELRAFETWLERIRSARAAEVRRLERAADDEVAARAIARNVA